MSHLKYTILVVDDDADARLVMRAALRKAGYAVRLADGGHDALRQFAAEPCDMVLLDVEMPDLGGHEVCARLRAQAGPLLPIVMVTGMDDLQSVEAAYEVGATDFIAKPVNWGLIGHRIRYLFRGHRTMLALQAAEADITRLAHYDSLTGLPNRRSFLARLDREIVRAERHGSVLALLFMDLDGFKNINDSLGHAAGDQLLQRAAERLRDGLRPTDLLSRPMDLDGASDSGFELARLGGDEFTALVINIGGPEDAVAVARRIGHMMRQPFVLDGCDLSLTTSVGIALYPADGRDSTTLLKHADTAMYHAKRLGRDNAQQYDVGLTQALLQKIELDSSLRTALERDEFHLVYQPQIDAQTGRMHAVEALLRWTHPVRGPVSPLEFIPLAEQNGLIEQIGLWVLQTACADAARWHAQGLALRVAVNLSPVQLSRPGLPQRVMSVLAKAGLSPAWLELEVTEGALMENTSSTGAALQALHDQGIKIALDDFGTGYSSLAYLTRMPISNIKIDRCFVSGLLDGGEREAIVRAVLAMANSLNMRVTAEGVETFAQARALKAMGCNDLQGFYFSRPVAAEAIAPMISRRWMVSDRDVMVDRAA